MIHITELWYVSLVLIWLCKRNRNQEVLETPYSSKSARTNSIEWWILNSNLIITEIDKIRPIQNKAQQGHKKFLVQVTVVQMSKPLALR